GRGLFGSMGESSSLFMPRELWHELHGLDEQFALPGGGLVNHDLYRRALAVGDRPLVGVAGGGGVYQIHCGAATSNKVSSGDMRANYEAIRGEPHQPPRNQPLIVGHFPDQYLQHLTWSVARAEELAARQSPESET